MTVERLKKQKIQGNINNQKRKKKKKKIIKKIEELNNIKPIWTKSPHDITKDECNKLYNSLTNNLGKYLTVYHCSSDNQLKFTVVIFIPGDRRPDRLHVDRKSINCTLKAYLSPTTAKI